MSWIDKIKTDFTIYCGEPTSVTNAETGAESTARPSFKVSWLNATRHIDYNIAEFVFKSVEGSYVSRGTARGTQYNIEIYFQGADHLDTASDFLNSSSDYNKTTGLATPWQIVHPFYGTIYVQPVSLTQDNSGYNVSKITGTVIETIQKVKAIIENGPEMIVSSSPTILQLGASAYASTVHTPNISDIQAAKNHIYGVFASISSKLNGYQQDVDSYLNQYNKVNALINETVYDAQSVAEQMQNLIVAPAYFADTIGSRIGMFESQLAIFAQDVGSILSIYNRATKNLKRLYENNAGAAVLGMCVAAVTNILNDYDYRITVLSTINTIISNYNTFLANLNALQSANGGGLDSYIPDADTITSLGTLVNLTTSTLFNISAGAKQQRTYTLPYDDNLILVAWKLYGLQTDDSTITTLRNNNNIGLNELLILKQGRQLVYYV